MLGVFIGPTMACGNFLQRLWKKPIWEGVWPYVDPWDIVCLRTASVEWNVAAKYWPHGELFFLLEDESVSSSVSQENNVCNDALHAIGLYGPGDKVSLSS